jgi:CubicO group peptidase (beta-lactamase class C family)
MGIAQGQDITAWAGAYVNTGTGGGMYSTIEDLLRWAKSGTGDSLLTMATVKARHDYRPISPLGIPYGLGQFVFPEQLPELPAFVGGFYGHDGDTIGFSTWAFKNDENGISFASNLNTCSSDPS